MADKFLIHGAFLRCDKGQVPSQLIVTSNPGVYIQDFFVATEADKIPLVNVQTFGMCAVSKGPCMPAPIIWTDTDPNVEVFGNQALLEKSCLMCSIGGKISPLESGQAPAAVLAPLPMQSSNTGTGINPSLAFVGVPAFLQQLGQAGALAAEAEAAATIAVAAEETSLAVSVLEGTAAVTGVLAADDVTVIGVADDVAIPFVVVGGLLIAGGIALYELFKKDDEVVTLPPSPVTVPRPVRLKPPGEVETEPVPVSPPVPVPLPPAPLPLPIPNPTQTPVPIPVPLSRPDADVKPKTKTKTKTKDKEDDPCKPRPVGYHLGNDEIHNMWADVYPPNRQEGTDWYLEGRNVPGGKNYDAYSPSGVLWEVKTENYKGYTKFLKNIHFSNAVKQAEKDRDTALSCSIPYKYGVTDDEFYNRLKLNSQMAPITVLMLPKNQPVGKP